MLASHAKKKCRSRCNQPELMFLIRTRKKSGTETSYYRTLKQWSTLVLLLGCMHELPILMAEAILHEKANWL